MGKEANLRERRSKLSPAKRALLEKRLQGGLPASFEARTIPRRPDQDVFPLSFAQQRLWFLAQLEPGSSVYNIPTALRLGGPLDVEALEHSFNEIVRRHESLRTTFSSVNGQPVQVIAPKLELDLPIVDLSGLPEAEREAEVGRLVTEDAQRPFDLEQGPLLRASLLRLGENEHVLLLTMHHIVSDGWSRGILLRELSALYEAFSTGRPSPLPELPVQYADYALWQREWLQGEVLETQLGYWKKQLEGAPPGLELPTDRPRPPIQTFQGGKQSFILSKSLTEKLKVLSQREGATLFMTLLSAFKTMLHRYTAQDDVVVGTPIAGRIRAETEGLIGPFLNSLVLRTDLSGNPTFLELLGRVRQTALEAYTHQDIPFERLLEELQPDRDLSRTPLFQIFFNMLQLEDSISELSGLTVEPFPLAAVQSNFDLTVYVRGQGEQLRLSFVYNADLFAKARMREMVAQFQHLVVQIADNPAQRLSRFSLVTPSAASILPDPRQPLSAHWHGAIHTHFAERARQSPEHLAVVDERESWAYQELDQRSNQLANYLQAKGIQPQDIVAIYGHRSATLVWAILGVLKAGAAFLILDPAYPAAHLTDYLCVANPRGWIQIEAAGALPEALERFLAGSSCCCRLVLSQRSDAEARGLLAGHPNEDPGVIVGPDDLAYVAFTSGSTGKPKGIMGKHGSLTHFLPWQQETFELDQSDRFSMLSGLSHDPLQRDIFTPLWVGATICVPDTDTIGAPGQLADWMAREETTFAHLTPAMGQILAATVTPDSRLSSLRYAWFVGDRLAQRDVDRLRRLAPGATCINSFGSTETQRAVSYYTIPPEPPDCAPLVGEEDQAKAVYPLGHGIPDVQLLVLNAEQHLAGVGELGEIHVRSPHLALGYLGDEALTQTRFLTNPFTGVSGDHLYKTGDLGCYLPDGDVEFVGRGDRQVKVRGFRIEPAEVEGALAQHPAVQEAVVMARDDTLGGWGLVAYLVGEGETAPTAEALRTFLQERLPSHMIPVAFMCLDALPLTPNGKVDRRALPAPDHTRPDLGESSLPPRDELERRLTTIWEQVLSVKPIGVRDNFFDLGGHSLLGVRLFAQIEKITGQSLSLATLFQAPTIEQLAEVLRHKVQTVPRSSLLAIQPAGSRPPFFCLPGNMGNVFSDLGDLARHLGPEQPFYGLQDGIHNPAQVEALAARYLEEIRAVQPEGPYFLGGLCSGGVIAFEMAQQLQAQGQRVALLAMVEPTSPRVPSLRSYLRHAVSILRRVVRRLGRHSRTLARRNPAEQGAYLRLKAKVVANVWSLTRYASKPYPGSIHLFLTRETLRSANNPRLGWRRLAAGGAEIHEIPGSHDTITGANDARIEETHIQVLAEQLGVCIDDALSNGNST